MLSFIDSETVDSLETREAFTDFTPLEVKSAKIITTEKNRLGREELNLEDCRDQFYDNQVKMAGVHSAVRK